MRKRFETIQGKCSEIVDYIMECPEIPQYEEFLVKFRLCADEAVQNIIDYAYDGREGWIEVSVDWEYSNNAFVIVIKDGGKQFNPIESPNPDLNIPIHERPIGGLGIYFFKQLMDDVSYEFKDGCNILKMTKRLITSPLSQSQLGIYFACINQNDDSANYQIPFLYSLPETIDLDKLKAALEDFKKAHPYVNSHIAVIDGEPVMLQGLFKEVPIIKVKDIDDPKLKLGKPMDILKDNLIRLEIYKTDKGNYLFIDLHHIIYDGSSFNVLVQDLGKAYSGETIQPEEMDGAAVALRETELRQSAEYELQKQWYLKEFGPAQELDSLPTPSSIERDDSNDGLVEKAFGLNVNESTISRLCEKYNIGKSVLMTAAWGKMLADYTAEERAYFATIYHGRNDKSQARTVSMMVHTLPVYMEMPADKPTNEWLSQLALQQETVRKYDAYSFSDIHQDLELRDDILFAYQGKMTLAENFPIQLGEQIITCRDLRKVRSGTILDAQVFNNPAPREMPSECSSHNDYTIKIAYDTSKYSAAMIDAMVKSYSAIINSMLDAKTVGDIVPASESQIQELDAGNPRPTKECIFDHSLIEDFRSNVEKQPDKIFCVYKDRSYTFSQFDRITDSLAAKIQQVIGSPSNQSETLPVVCFICPRNEWMAIMPVAAIKAGCTYQPLDSSYPTDRLAFMVQDSSASLLICTEEFRDLLPSMKDKLLIVNDPDALYDGAKPGNVSFRKDDTFVLLYTSGTTGQPKGVQITHGNIRIFIKTSIRNQGLDNTVRYASYASYGFDAFAMDLWSLMKAGGTMYIIDEDIRYDLTSIKDMIEREGITHCFMTTQVGYQMACSFPDIPCLKWLGVGGEKLVSMPVPSYHFFNMYGPTETIAYVTTYDVLKVEKNIPIGHPMGYNNIYIVNRSGKRLPLGAAGELWISGPQVSKGYLNLPEKSSAVFIHNPFVKKGEEEFHSTVYRTGDIVRFREDGQIEFIGRKDGQVKIRGFRIELKEVETIIGQFPGVRAVTVQAFDLEAGGKAIAAYVVSDEKIDVDQLNSFIVAEKPPYMVPAVTMQIDAIPLNVNGKVDKKQLPKPEKKMDTQTQSAPVAPLNVLEQELVYMVGSLTGTSDFGVSLPLSYVGLTSISSLKLSVQLYKKYGINVNVNSLTHGATIQTIENQILESLLGGKSQNAPAAIAETITEDWSAPLSNAQLGVYYECLKDEMSTVYNVPQVITFPDSVSPQQLKTAVEKVIELHPLLSARIDNSVDPPVQNASRGAKAVVEVSDKPLEEIKRDFVRPFDLAHSPMYRALVTGHTLFFDAHHLAMDGSSVSVFLHQVCDLLEDRPVENEDCSFFEYAANEQKQDHSAAEAFFMESLSTVDDATALPADLHGDEAAGRQAEVALPVDGDAVASFAKERGVTPASVYLAATEYLLARYGNVKEVCLCTVSTGRGDVRTSGTVGMFVNTLAITAHITDCKVGEFVGLTAQHFGKVLENENYPFARVAEKFGIAPQVMFVYQLGVVDKFEVGSKEVKTETLGLSAPKFKCTLLVEERNGQVNLVSEYNDALYSAGYMSRMLESLAQVLENIIADPSAKLTGLSIIAPSQKAELETMRHICDSPVPVKLFHKGIERWAESKPDQIAVYTTAKSLTYRELNLEANRVANALIQRGLKRGDAVVVLLPRRSSTISCVLGIMKAGGAFIPCDPEYPAERIRLIASDSGASFVITTPDLVGEYGGKGVCIDELLTCTNMNDPAVDVTPGDLAYMIYTSGSTGRPKGVCVEHGNITVNFSLTEANPYHSMIDCSRICTIFSISFDAFIFDFGETLFNGRTLVFANEEEAKDPIALVSLMQRTETDYFGCTSSRMLQYLELPEFVACVKKLKCILQGGEKFSESLLLRLQKINPSMDIINGYGPTEVGISCNAVNLKDAPMVTVGKPLPNYTEWILDQDGNELPVGVTGELCAGGPGITRGYRNLPDKTAEKFIEYGGMRAFKTGDFARWMADGQIEILGRTDNQVKLRGLRIELGEVESAISKVEGIKNVLVKICNIQGTDHLSAYYSADRVIPAADLKRAIGSTLTAYMVPDAYLQMDALPMTPNGKIDFRHLPDPQLVQTERDYVVPANAAEKFFAETFASVLNLDKVGATDSFFDLGGTSLIVMRVVILSQQAGYKITYADVFANPSPRALAAFVNRGSEENEDPDADIRDFDYETLEETLGKNSLDTFLKDTSLRPLGNILLTGATGFLGIHVLNTLLSDYPDTHIYCMLRSRKGVSVDERLLQMMFYYFEHDYSKEFKNRVTVFEGDTTDPISTDAHIDTVINCAALVKHFAKGSEIEDVNVGGVRNCIDFCLRTGARLIQISTYSVGGASVNGLPDIKAFSENMLFKGQRIHNQYVHSKIMGERLILDAVAHNGLDAKIMRVGNLSARSKDGEFQINTRSNSFMGRLRIFEMLGAQPFQSYTSPVEFSPIDQTARAICLLAGTNPSCTIFHPYNNHSQMLGDVVSQMEKLGKEIRLVEYDEFRRIIDKAKEKKENQEDLSAMLAYEVKNDNSVLHVIPPDNEFTIQVLLRLGFKWDFTSWDYEQQFLQQIDGLNFFTPLK